MNNWTPSIDSLLDKIRLSCIQLTNRHIQNHFILLKGRVLIFEIPTIYIKCFLVEVFSVGSEIFS